MQIWTDVVVVGARVAGSATAMLLARLGHDVLLLDRADLPTDAISTHQIARTGVVALRRWGLLETVLATGAPALRQVTFGARSDGAGRVTGVRGHNRRGHPVEVAARFVVGADGLRSRVARAVGAGLTEDRGFGGATRYAYFAGLPWSGIEFFTGTRWPPALRPDWPTSRRRGGSG